MNELGSAQGDSRRSPTRRAWLIDCSSLVGAALATLTMPAGAQGTGAATSPGRATGGALQGGSAASRTGPTGHAAGGVDVTPAGRPLILVVGDSLSAEYGLARGSGWVALLTARLAERSPRATVVNASISGDTTAGGRTRLPALLVQHRPDIVVLELGGNDALRGLPLAATRDNLVAMTRAARAAKAQVVIAGMQLPPNYGKRYGDEFAALYASIAKDEGAALVPFLLAGVADGPQAEAMFQADRIHPLASAHPRILANVWPVLEPLIQRRGSR